MRELIRAEERLLFERHSQPQNRPIRKAAEAAGGSDTEPQTGLTFPRERGFLGRKELY